MTSLDVCWNGSCHTYPLTSNSETVAAGATCTGPADACMARMRETGGKTGFAMIPGLPAAPVQVIFAGQTATVAPEIRYPNGPDCGGGGPQGQLTVDEKGMR
ncbi:hypothetical protein [Amycolatopsis pithecellobii]|uniref:Uncharacterized protein n=1 Tax=Amycolatopsis pithecellobii TaxID=664692 RepID=A0A6N7Z203_9PSEU|nr:hypothetical protein [Amycolatopsis pithecellobii]MTD54829.1 hypothetical protein [Amycolatopsis pithecellobii]